MNKIIVLFLCIVNAYTTCMDQRAVGELSFAIQCGNIGGVKRIIESGAIKINDLIGNYTPLGLAVVHDRIAVTQLLLLYPDIDINKQFPSGPFALSRVTSVAVCKQLLKGGADPNKKDDQGRSAFAHALIWGRAPEKAIELMVQKKAIINDTINNGSLLKMMIKLGRAHYIPILLRYGASVTPEIVPKSLSLTLKQLLDAYLFTVQCAYCSHYFPGLNIKNKNTFKCSDCLFAESIEKDDAKTIKKLINCWPWHINDHNVDGKMLIYVAVKKNAKNVFTFLLSVGADIQKKTQNNRCVWHALRKVDMINVILSEQRTINLTRPLINTVDWNGLSPLAYAMRGNREDIFSRLLVLKAEYIRNYVKDSPLYWAIVDKKPQFVSLSIGAGESLTLRMMKPIQKNFSEKEDFWRKLHEVYVAQVCLVCCENGAEPILCENKHTGNFLCPCCFKELKKDGTFRCPLCRSEEKIHK
jgi:ankyrin repeat protein